MATIIKSTERDFQESPGKIDNFKIFTDVSRIQKGINPQNLNFDLRQLNPGEYSAPYHFHKFAEELFMVISGSATLRTPKGLEIVNTGDLMFFEKGETGAHQLFNHAGEPCVYLDIRTFIGFDVCEYPDSQKVLIVPGYEIYNKNSTVGYFKGEEHVTEKWKEL